jgi:hypothetical protein
MTVLIPLIVVVASGLAFVAYKHPNAYRVMFIFAVPVLVMGGFLVIAIKIGDLNATIKSIYHELPNIRKYALSDQLPYQIIRLYGIGQFLKVFLIYYISGFAYLVFLLVLRGLLDLGKDRNHTPTWYGADVTGAVYRSAQAQRRFQGTASLHDSTLDPFRRSTSLICRHSASQPFLSALVRLDKYLFRPHVGNRIVVKFLAATTRLFEKRQAILFRNDAFDYLEWMRMPMGHHLAALSASCIVDVPLTKNRRGFTKVVRYSRLLL